jgi:phosphate transport system protein
VYNGFAMSSHFNRQIDKLKQMILWLGTLVEESVESAIRAVKTRDVRLARQVIQGDSKIDQMEVEIEEECLHTLALYNPVANDLRFVVSVLKINGDLERIADKAVNIAEQVSSLIESPLVDTVPFDFLGQSERVRSMLKKSLDALVNADAELADWVRHTDDSVDKVHREMGRGVKQAIREHPDQVDGLLTLWSLSRQLERIADHAVNIAEDVIYMVKGDILRHVHDAAGHPAPSPGDGPPAAPRSSQV